MVSAEVPSLSSTNLYRYFTAMREEILKHKWYESERAGRDVGFEYALVNWTMRFRNIWQAKTKAPS
jgi:hypothetical protein